MFRYKILVFVGCLIQSSSLLAQKYGEVYAALPYMYMNHSSLHAYGLNIQYNSPKVYQFNLLLRRSFMYGGGNRGIVLEKGVPYSFEHPGFQDWLGRDINGEEKSYYTAHSHQAMLDFGLMKSFNLKNQWSVMGELGLSYLQVRKHYVVGIEEVTVGLDNQIIAEFNHLVPYQLYINRVTYFVGAGALYAIHAKMDLSCTTRYHHLSNNHGSIMAEFGLAFKLN